MSETPISAFDLLEDDLSGQGLKKLQERLVDMRTNLRRCMDKGLDPDDFSVAKRLLAAVEAAESVLLQLRTN
ncbi:MAG: hypothetical protein IJS54_06110 [Desulfovibrio sp.]|nr:hypothetical protein [Desulfovibrio sp.]